MHNKFAQKFLSIGVSVSLMLAMAPNNGAFAADEPTVFTASAYANHWGRSDLRAYLNNMTKTNNTLPIDSTVEGTNAANYPSQFSDEEYDLVQPFTYSTNVLNYSQEAETTYETTDKFWLPSANVSRYGVLSWSSSDTSAMSQYLTTTTGDKQRLIPTSYRSYSDSYYGHLRSARYGNRDYSLRASRGGSIEPGTVSYDYGVAAACKINVEDVIFASAASAQAIVGKSASGAKKITTAGSSRFGWVYADALPDYGMYLKSKSDETFTPTAVTNSSGKLTVTYNGGAVGQYVVVHAFKNDNLESDTAHYCGAAEISSTDDGSTVTIDFGVDGVGLTSFEDYTIKVWMEDGTASNLAAATTPVTFYGASSSIGLSGTEAKNARVFAMKSDLQTSWGDLSKLNEDAYNNVISGIAQSGNGYGTVHGVNPTNQKIYFGTDSDGNPLEFWIAGRETAANGGKIDETGEVMTLYQAKSVESKAFNASTSNYKYTPTASDFTFAAPENLTYDGSEKTATVTGGDGVGVITVKYYDSDGNKLDSAPINIGTYTVKIDVAASDSYDAATNLTDESWRFEIKQATPNIPNKTDWGTAEIHSGITHYVNADGMTSVEISDENMASNGIIWLKEESYGSSAWYGLDNSSKIFEEGSRFYVQWLNETEHPEAFEDIDDATRAEVEGNNGWLFKVGVIRPNGERYENLTKSVDLYVQIGDDWDKNDLEGFYISQTEDEKIVVKYSDKTYPDGNDEFGIMSLSHFSPYFIYDKLTAEEKAELNALMGEIASQQEEKSTAETEENSEESTSDSSVKTGDEVIYFTVSSLTLIMTLALGLMLVSKANKKKIDE